MSLDRLTLRPTKWSRIILTNTILPVYIVSNKHFSLRRNRHKNFVLEKIPTIFKKPAMWKLWNEINNTEW